MSEKLEKAVKQAEKASAGVSDPELRKVAFDRLLSHLLSDGATNAGSAIAPRTKRTAPASAGQRMRIATRGGPKMWLEDLINEGFFRKQQFNGQIIERLAENGHHLRPSDITKQLEMLLHERKLRRKKVQTKMPDGREMKVWGYSNW